MVNGALDMGNAVNRLNNVSRGKGTRIELEACFSFGKTAEAEGMAGVGLNILDADWSATVSQPASRPRFHAVLVIREEYTRTRKDKETKMSLR